MALGCKYKLLAILKMSRLMGSISIFFFSDAVHGTTVS